jgi:microcystin-dependent protein
MADPFIAEIKIFAGNFAPRGWAFCDGQLLPISQNTALFALIGTTYGGDGRTTTGLPNLQGRAAMQPRTGPGLTTRRLGERRGAEKETLTTAQMPTHNHTASTTLAPGNEDDPQGDALLAGGQTAATKLYSPAGTALGGKMAAQALPEFGAASPQAHDNMQPYLTLNFIIALIGTFPSRS